MPNRREIEIYRLEIVNPAGADLEFQQGGWGSVEGELLTADGKSYGLYEEEDEETGETLVAAS